MNWIILASSATAAAIPSIGCTAEDQTCPTATRERCVDELPQVIPPYDVERDAFELLDIALLSRCSPTPSCDNSGSGTADCAFDDVANDVQNLTWWCDEQIAVLAEAYEATPGTGTDHYVVFVDLDAARRTVRSGFRLVGNGRENFREYTYWHDAGTTLSSILRNVTDDAGVDFPCAAETLTFDENGNPLVHDLSDPCAPGGRSFRDVYTSEVVAGVPRVVQRDIDKDGDGDVDIVQTIEYDDAGVPIRLNQGTSAGVTEVRIGDCNQACDLELRSDGFEIDVAGGI